VHRSESVSLHVDSLYAKVMEDVKALAAFSMVFSSLNLESRL